MFYTSETSLSIEPRIYLEAGVVVPREQHVPCIQFWLGAQLQPLASVEMFEVSSVADPC